METPKNWEHFDNEYFEECISIYKIKKIFDILHVKISNKEMRRKMNIYFYLTFFIFLKLTTRENSDSLPAVSSGVDYRL